MPDPGAQRGGSDSSGFGESGEFDASIESTGVNLNDVAAAISEGPLGALNLSPVTQAVLGFAIPGIGIPGALHGIAKSIGGGIRGIADALGLETSALAIDTSFQNVGDSSNKSDTALNKITQMAANFGLAQQQSGSLGIASNLSLGTGDPLLPTLQALGGMPASRNITPDGIGTQILKQAGAEKLKEMLMESGEKTQAEKATPTQQTNKPVAQAQKSREEGRSEFEQLFFDLLNKQLKIQR